MEKGLNKLKKQILEARKTAENLMEKHQVKLDSFKACEMETEKYNKVEANQDYIESIFYDLESIIESISFIGKED